MNRFEHLLQSKQFIASLEWASFLCLQTEIKHFCKFFYFFSIDFFLFHFTWNISVKCFCVSFRTVVFCRRYYSFWFYLQLKLIKNLLIRFYTSGGIEKNNHQNMLWCDKYCIVLSDDLIRPNQTLERYR